MGNAGIGLNEISRKGISKEEALQISPRELDY